MIIKKKTMQIIIFDSVKKFEHFDISDMVAKEGWVINYINI